MIADGEEVEETTDEIFNVIMKQDDHQTAKTEAEYDPLMLQEINALEQANRGINDQINQYGILSGLDQYNNYPLKREQTNFEKVEQEILEKATFVNEYENQLR